MVTVSDLNAEIRDRWNAIIGMLNTVPFLLYPVGTLYFNANVSTNPGTLLGFGTWVLWGAGRVPVCVDSGQPEFDALEETGGEKTHLLTTGEMPVHNHPLQTPSAGGGINQLATTGGNGDAAQVLGGAAPVQNSGGGAAHNNLPPYITCYIWKRTA